jgi:hypothetical protein
MTYVCPACELEADVYLMKVQSLQNNFLPNIGNLTRRAKTHELHVPFSFPYIYDTRLCMQQADIIRDHESAYIPNKGKGEA